MSFISSPFPSCFCPSKTTDDHHPPPPPPPPPLSPNPNLTTYIYHTDAGTVSLTWSRSILSRSLHVHLHHHPFHSPSFHLHIKPFIFWKKHGTKKLSHNTRIFWNLSRARFGSGPEPHSGFYVALVVDHALTLLVGDVSSKDAQSKCKAREPKNRQVLMLKREHVDVFAQRVYNTKAKFGGKVREIGIDYCGFDHRDNSSSRLLFVVDEETVLEVKRLKWKFRGNERIEVDGVTVLISWDVHDWVFEKGNNNNSSDGHAVFMFKFEEEEAEEEDRSLVNVWTQQNWSLGSSCEWGKMGKSWSSSSVSVSSSAGSFGGSSSVMEWSSVEENELVVPVGFSLLVYAWKR